VARLTWAVTSVTVDQVKSDNAGHVIEGSYVYYLTGDGHDGVVFVPNSVFGDAAKVKAAIHESAHKLEAVYALSVT
jgi:hypothetical protein